MQTPTTSRGPGHVAILKTWRRGRAAQAGLIVAGLLVAVAIMLDGPASRALNGLGAIAWIGSTALLVVALRSDRRWPIRLALVTAVAAGLSVLVEPDRMVIALPAFAVGGAIVAATGARPMAWAMVVAGMWLPVHLLTAVIPAILADGDGGAVRSDPPPTAALVPLSMIVGAILGGLVVAVVRNELARRSTADDRRKSASADPERIG